MVAPRIAMMGGRRIVDPYWANVVLLCDFNGADGSTTITDRSDSAHTMTAHGDAQLDTTQKKFGSASLLLDGTGDYVSAADSADWHFGDGEWTVEAHIRRGSLAAGTICGQRTVPGLGRWVCFMTNTHMSFAGGGTMGADSTISQAFSWSTDIWYHVAWVRSGDILYMFVDGSLLGFAGDALSDDLIDVPDPLTIGSNASTSYFDGWIDNLRITKGVARYTANFTPPVRAFPTR